MDPNTPPSPAASGDLPNGFAALVQHNSITSYPRDMADSMRVHSQPASRYGTPGPSYEASFDDYSYQPFSHEGSPYSHVASDMNAMDSHAYSTPATSPPTPTRAAEAITTRSGMRVARGGTSKTLAPKHAGIQKTKAASKKKIKKANDGPADLEAMTQTPLSKTCAQADAKLAEMAAFVGRSTAERVAELQKGKNPGKIKRPMNAFMLYRKVFQEEARHVTSETNHQVLSKVCGLSWRSEDEAVVEQFKAWADLERQNHAKAHPDYKFTPSKSTKGKVVKARGFNDDDASDLEDPDWEGGGRHRRTRQDHPDAEYNPPRGLIPQSHFALMGATDGHRSLPHQYEQWGQYGQQPVMSHEQYYHQVGYQMTEDMMHRTPSPGIMYPPVPQYHHQPHHVQYYSPAPQQRSSYPPPPQHHQATQVGLRPQVMEGRIDPLLMGNQFQDFGQNGYYGEPEEQYSGVGVDDMFQGDDNMLRGEGDWQLEELPQVDIDSNMWIDPAMTSMPSMGDELKGEGEH